jgi:hypothetical protein
VTPVVLTVITSRRNSDNCEVGAELYILFSFKFFGQLEKIMQKAKMHFYFEEKKPFIFYSFI